MELQVLEGDQTMEMPIDIGKMRKVAEDIQLDIDVNININVYLDKTCDENMINSICDYFEEADNTVSINYIPIEKTELHLDYNPDFAVIISGQNDDCALCYEALVENHIAAFIVTVDPKNFIDAAKINRIRVPRENLICPNIKSYTTSVDDEGESFIDLDRYNVSMDLDIKDKIVKWLYNFAYTAEIIYAAKFPFLRSKIATSLINSCSFENAGIGLIKILPGADLPLMTLNQARMILELAAIYGYSIDEDRILEIVTVVISAFGMRYLSQYVKKATPIAGFIVDGASGLIATQALGNIAKEYFASGMAIDGLVEKVKELPSLFRLKKS